MSSFAPAEELRQKRPLLLACEAIGWFHMAGKAHANFLRNHGGMETDYDFKKWHERENPPFIWDNFLGWLKTAFPGVKWPGSFAEFTEKHAGRGEAGILGLLQAGHGMASGIEKQSYPQETVRYLGQDFTHMWLSSAFGHPERNLLADPPQVLTESGWRQLVAEIRRVLEELRNLGTQGVQDPSIWAGWRKKAIGQDSYVRHAFLSTIAETRLPNNDVTLWDQSYVAAALFKSAVAGAILDRNFPWGERAIKQHTRWRLLTVGIGTDHYEARAVKIGDWTGAHAAVEAFFERVCQLVEVDLAVGSLLYQDSHVCVFTFPGERFDERSSSGTSFDENNMAQWLKGWKDYLQKEIDSFAREYYLETPPYVHLSSPTRSLVPVVRERREADKKLAVPVHRPWAICDNQTKDFGHTCPVCQVRLNGKPTNKDQPCEVCKERRTHRLQDLLNGRLGKDTIWLEEVADTNGRIALLTFHLDIEPWLNGERVDSLRAQAIAEWRRFNPAKTNGIDPMLPYVSLKSYVQSKLGSFDPNDKVLRSIHSGYQHERDWKDFYAKIVEDRANAPFWDNCRDEDRSSWLVHQLFRKLPSPGRVYRFWRQTEEFFQELLQEFRQIASSHPNRWRVRRLWLVPDNSTRSGWQEGELYNGRWRDQLVSLIYHNGGFLTAFNLARALRPEDQASELLKDEFKLWEPDASPLSTTLQPLNVKQAQDIPRSFGHLGVYHPVIPLEVSPLRFRVLVPLEAASECVDLALTCWEEAFVRVLDRLPLRVGVVAFPAKTAFQAVLEMVRSLEAEMEESEPENWRVCSAKSQDSMMTIAFKREDGEQELWTVPIRFPDGRKDVFYPYVAVKDRQIRFPLDFQHPEGQVYRHMEDLRPGDDVHICPARIATVFMDTTARRFEKPQVRYLTDWQRMRQVWRILAERTPSVTQLQQVRQELSRLAENWDIKRNPEAKEIWLQLARAVLHDALNVKGALLEELLDAARTGILLWAIDWHLSIIKEKPVQTRR